MPLASQSCRAVGLSMSATSHIVDIGATEKFHSLRKAESRPAAHNVDMDKNGGPNHLKAWREYRKLTQEALAAKVDTTATVISMLESGDRGLSAKWLRKLAPALGTTPGHLLDHDPRTLPSDILDIWVNANSDQKRQLVDVAKAVVRTGTDS